MLAGLMDHERLMRLWRQDLQRTDYGGRRDPRPPLKMIKRSPYLRGAADLPGKNESRMMVGRVMRRLQRQGWLLKEMAEYWGFSDAATWHYINYGV